jgi:hypothetical protein
LGAGRTVVKGTSLVAIGYELLVNGE